MKLSSYHKMNRNFILISMVIYLLSSFIWQEINVLYAREIGQDGPEAIPAPTLADEKREMEGGDMADTGKLTEEEGNYLLSVAKKTIEKRLYNREKKIDPGMIVSSKFSKRRGTFVTLTIDGALRGCIGHIIPQESLIEGIRVNAINAAFRDPRFRPLSKKEWERVEVEISILTDPKPLLFSNADDLLRKLRPGIDGVIIKKGLHQATFLPQVWEQLHDKKEFLTHLCLKAGLDGHAWKKEGLEVSTYQVQAFKEH